MFYGVKFDGFAMQGLGFRPGALGFRFAFLGLGFGFRGRVRGVGLAKRYPNFLCKILVSRCLQNVAWPLTSCFILCCAED